MRATDGATLSRVLGVKGRRLFECTFESKILRRNADGAVLEVLLVVHLDVVQRIEVVDHHAKGLFHALVRSVAEPVQTMGTRSVAEMEIRYRVQRQMATLLHKDISLNEGKES